MKAEKPVILNPVLYTLQERGAGKTFDVLAHGGAIQQEPADHVIKMARTGPTSE